MSQVIVTLDLPDEVKGSPLEQKFQATTEKLLREQTVLRLYQEKEISAETGAKLLGISLYDFIQFLSRNNLAVFDLSEEELSQDMAEAQKAIGNKENDEQ